MDIFKWNALDGGTVASLARDVITDFDTKSVIQGGDILDIRDLLVGETSSNLVNYLNFSKSGSDTLINISTTGGYSNGVYSATATTQQIILEGIDLTTGQTNASVINNLLAQQKLIVD